MMRVNEFVKAGCYAQYLMTSEAPRVGEARAFECVVDKVMHGDGPGAGNLY